MTVSTSSTPLDLMTVSTSLMTVSISSTLLDLMTVSTSSIPIMTVSTNTTAVVNHQTLIISISVAVAVGTVIFIIIIVLISTLLVLFIRRKTYRNEEHKDNIVNDIPMDDNVAYHHVVVDNDHIVDNVAYHVVVETTNVTSTIEEYDYI